MYEQGKVNVRAARIDNTAFVYCGLPANICYLSRRFRPIYSAKLSKALWPTAWCQKARALLDISAQGIYPPTLHISSYTPLWKVG